MIIKFNGSGNLPRAIFFVFLIIGLAPLLFSQENDLESVLNEVARHLAARDFSSALELFSMLPPEEAGRTEILIMQASILNSAGRASEARLIANRITASDSNNTEALMILADAAALEGRDRDRRNFLERVIVINPGHARALNDLGNIALGNQNLFVAASYFDRALAAEPNNGESLVGRAVVHRYNRESGRSEMLLDRAAGLYPEWARPLHERARLYRGAGFYADALEDLSDALKLEPDNYWIIVDRGQVFMDVGLKQEALADFTRAIEIAPDVFLAYVFTAGLKEEFGDYEGAEQDYKILARIRPEYYFAFEALGALYIKNKQWSQARDAFLDAYRQAPREYSYAILASICWMRAGRQTDPRQFLAQVMRTAPRDTIEFSMLRLFHDLSGDIDVVRRVESENNIYKKSQMAFYLASYYDITGSRTLADRFYLMVQDLDAVGTIEWKINEWILAERGIGIRAAQ